MRKKHFLKQISTLRNKIKTNIVAKAILVSFLLELFFLAILPGIIIGGMGLFQGKVAPFSSNPPNYVLPLPETISVYRHKTSTVEEIPFEDYIKGVVAGEMPSSFELEALKAQSVAARTYSFSKVIRSGDSGFPTAHPQAPICDDTHCQVYRDTEELQALKGQAWMEDGWKKISKAVDSTKGQLMYYKGELVEQPLFHSSSGGKTENSEDVFASSYPYLKSVSSPYEEGATHQDETKSFSTNDFVYLLNLKCSDRYLALPIEKISISAKSEGGRVEEIMINDTAYTGREVREALGLSSANFEVDHNKSDASVTFTTDGYGHGVGMSQYGANGMAKRGSDYKEILQHYYQGTAIY